MDEVWLQLIDNNEYIKKCIIKNNKDINSLIYLVDRKISHSTSIKLGIALGKLLYDFILYKTKFISIKEKNKKGKQETDHLFRCDIKKEIIYAEIKSNINLDTEKVKETIRKCINIKTDLESKYTTHKIKIFLVVIRYYTKNIIPNNILYKYNEIKNNIIGVNEYLEEYGIEYKIDNEKELKNIINKVVENMYNKN